MKAAKGGYVNLPGENDGTTRLGGWVGVAKVSHIMCAKHDVMSLPSLFVSCHR